MFKASKVVPVMIVSVLYQGHKYTTVEYVNASLLCGAISLFLLGDSEVSPDFDIKGVLLISLGVLCDAFTSNYEERHFFKEHGHGALLSLATNPP
jgi:adenosine 3'-phospho 5'-phosphosulfate transporter B3